MINSFSKKPEIIVLKSILGLTHSNTNCYLEFSNVLPYLISCVFIFRLQRSSKVSGQTNQTNKTKSILNDHRPQSPYFFAWIPQFRNQGSLSSLSRTGWKPYKIEAPHMQCTSVCTLHFCSCRSLRDGLCISSCESVFCKIWVLLR